jgi:anoctamin-10/anoctamin-7
MELDVIIQSTTGKSYNRALLDGYLAPFFAVFISYWSQFMLEYWKRKERFKAMEWGTSEFESIERERPDFIGELQPSVVNGKMAKFFPPDEAKKRKNYSSFIIGLMILLVLGCVSFIFFLQVIVTRSSNVTIQTFGSLFTSVLNAIQIQVLNIVYEKVAITLTKNENYRTDTAFEDALIAKLFSFQFVNSYASFYYVAFIKYIIVKAKCADTECSIMYELGFNLAIVFFIRLCVSKVQSFLTLYVNTGLKEKSDQKEFANFVKQNPSKSSRKKSKPEYEFNLEEYDSLMGTLSNYAELAVQFGYVTLFVVAFPLAPFMAYVSNLVEFRSDGYQLLFMNIRVLPVGCQDIGTWMSIFQTMAIIAVVTNSAIVCFTMKVLPISLAGKVWVFIGLQYFIFSSMALFEYLIDDIPYEVSLQLERQEYICERLEEDDFDQMEEASIKRRKSTKIANEMILHDEDATII